MQRRRRDIALEIWRRRAIIRALALWEGTIMKSFLIACAAAVIIAVGAAMVLDRYQEPTAVAYSTTAVRL
jgi:hypothetical protein